MKKSVRKMMLIQLIGVVGVIGVTVLAVLVIPFVLLWGVLCCIGILMPKHVGYPLAKVVLRQTEKWQRSIVQLGVKKAMQRTS